MQLKRICYACDLIDDLELIEEYKKYHLAENARPEITKSIKDAGVVSMEIYLLGNRLFMIMEVDETFTPERKQLMDCKSRCSEVGAANVEISAGASWGKTGRKVAKMEQIYKLP